jgi:hypothetical protein
MGGNWIKYLGYMSAGFVLGVVYGIWTTSGFDMSYLRSNLDILGLAGYGAGGALLGFILCWFL